jgi:UDP-glucose 4,6-dehydratase
VIDVARHVCGVFGLDPGEAVATVSDRPFNDHKYFVDD